MIPFILLGISVVSGTIGIAEGIEGIGKLSRAKKIVKENKERYEKEYNTTKLALDNFNTELEKVGKAKVNLHHLRKRIKRCLDSVRKKTKLKEISLNSEVMVNIDSFCSNLQADIEYTDELLSGILKAAGSSYLTYVGSMGIATSIGTASTGTAIASLSGAAAENAILAWFGGGALSAGGGGIALGSVVLSGIVAGPAIFFTGFSLSKAGEKALTQAKEFESKVRTEVKKMEILRKEIETSINWFSSYCKVSREIEEKAYEILEEIENANSEKEIKNFLVILVLIAQKGIRPLLEMEILEKNSFKVSEKAKRIIESHNRFLKDIHKETYKVRCQEFIPKTLI